VSVCAYCGRDNEAGAQLCTDCGKPLTRTAATVRAAAGGTPAPGFTPGPGSGAVGLATPPPPSIGCRFCGRTVSAALPFCPHCGRRLVAPGSGPACARCYSPVAIGTRFCAVCGAPLDEGGALTSASAPSRADYRLTLVVLDESGQSVQRFERASLETTVGREDGDLRFPDDQFLSPLHAKLSWEGRRLVVRDLGSRNGTWVFLDGPHRLADDDVLLIGSQLLRFRRLGYPGPHARDVDETQRMGSATPSADIATLLQLRADGSTRDVIHLSPGRDVYIGRERGDWIFPYDPSMSSQHAVIRSEDADFVVVDTNSRNGVALAARGDIDLRDGSKLLVGDKLLRIELPA